VRFGGSEEILPALARHLNETGGLDLKECFVDGTFVPAAMGAGVSVESGVPTHLQASLLGTLLTVPIKEGKLVLGTWQQVFHLEWDVKP
jgi:hypothetical protein